MLRNSLLSPETKISKKRKFVSNSNIMLIPSILRLKFIPNEEIQGEKNIICSPDEKFDRNKKDTVIIHPGIQEKKVWKPWLSRSVMITEPVSCSPCNLANCLSASFSLIFKIIFFLKNKIIIEDINGNIIRYSTDICIIFNNANLLIFFN